MAMTKPPSGSDTTVRQLAPGDRDDVETFLKKHASTSMFLRSNLRSAGFEDRGERYQATYLGVFRDLALTGVIAHCWNGVILPQAPATDDLLELAYAILTLPSVALRGITGASGDDRQVNAIMALLDVHIGALQMDHVEGLYSLDLSDLRAPASFVQGDVLCRRAEERDFSNLLSWRMAYDVEALSRSENDARAEETAAWLRDQIERGEAFVLEDPRSGRLLATSAFNATVPDTVQIGAVYTPPSLRGRAYARAVVAGQLQIAQADGVKTAILFSANEAAIHSYEAVGFRRIGAFRLVLLKTPWFPAPR